MAVDAAENAVAAATDLALVAFFRLNWPVAAFRFCGLYHLHEETFYAFLANVSFGKPNADTVYDPVRFALREFMAYRTVPGRCSPSGRDTQWKPWSLPD